MGKNNESVEKKSSNFTLSVFVIFLIVALIKDILELILAGLNLIPLVGVVTTILSPAISAPFLLFFFISTLLLNLRPTWFWAVQLVDTIPIFSAFVPTTLAVIILYLLEHKKGKLPLKIAPQALKLS